MANISAYLQKILDAVYGEEVRGSIHDALAAMNTEASNAMQYASTAKDSAQASASAAQASASAAEQKAGEASVSAGTAKTAASSAKASETNAKASANTAQAAQTAASAARVDAAAAKTAAQAAQTAAESAKAASEAARDDAEGFRDTAETSALSAAASALSAQQYSGKPPKPLNGTWWIWDAAAQEYTDSNISCELEGPAGTSIAGIELASGDHSPGTTDIYTVTLTDGTAYNISVYNGRNGTGAGDVLGIWFDLVLPASGWLNGEITVADSRLLAQATHKYFVSADEASREEYLECGVRPRDVSTTGFITFRNDIDPSEDITVNVIRFELSANGT